jgi:hypothetical protein
MKYEHLILRAPAGCTWLSFRSSTYYTTQTKQKKENKFDFIFSFLFLFCQNILNWELDHHHHHYLKKKKENGADQQLVKDDGLKTRQTTLDTHEPTQF